MTSGIVFNRGEKPVSVSYDCNRYRDSNHQKCSRHYIRQEVLMDTLKHFFDKQVEIAVDAEQMILGAQKKVDAPDGIKSRLASARTQRINLETKMDQLLEDAASGILDRAEYAQIKAQYQQEKASVQQQEEQLYQEYQELKAGLGTAETWLADIRRYQAMPRIDREIVDTLIERIVVSKDRDVHICLTYQDPFAVLNTSLNNEEKGGSYVSE